MVARQKLIEQLSELIDRESAEKSFVSTVDSVMKIHGVETGETNDLLYHTEKLSEVSDELLFWLTDACNAYQKIIKIEDYFTKHEMKYRSASLQQESEDVYPIIFEDMIRVREDQFIGKLDVDTFYKLYKNAIINYNFNTQRNRRKFKTKSGDYSYRIHVNKKSLKEISNLMSDDDYIPDTITLNLNKDNPDTNFEYDEKNRRIIVYEGQLDIPDGYHRYRSLINNKINDPNWEYYMELRIVNFDEAKANRLISQSNKRNEINKTFLKTLNDKDPINILINRLSEDSRCSLNISRQNSKYWYTADFYVAIQNWLTVKNNSDVVKYSKYLREVFNALIEDEVCDGSRLDIFLAIKGAALYENKDNYIENIEKYISNKPKVDTIQIQKLIKLINEGW